MMWLLVVSRIQNLFVPVSYYWFVHPRDYTCLQQLIPYKYILMSHRVTFTMNMKSRLLFSLNHTQIHTHTLTYQSLPGHSGQILHICLQNKWKDSKLNNAQCPIYSLCNYTPSLTLLLTQMHTAASNRWVQQPRSLWQLELGQRNELQQVDLSAEAKTKWSNFFFLLLNLSRIWFLCLLYYLYTHAVFPSVSVSVCPCITKTALLERGL